MATLYTYIVYPLALWGNPPIVNVAGESGDWAAITFPRSARGFSPPPPTPPTTGVTVQVSAVVFPAESFSAVHEPPLTAR